LSIPRSLPRPVVVEEVSQGGVPAARGRTVLTPGRPDACCRRMPEGSGGLCCCGALLQAVMAQIRWGAWQIRRADMPWPRSGCLWRGAGYMPASPNSLTHGAAGSPGRAGIGLRPNEPSSPRFHAPDGSALPKRRRRRTRHRSAVAVLSALSARIDLVIASRSGSRSAHGCLTSQTITSTTAAACSDADHGVRQHRLGDARRSGALPVAVVPDHRAGPGRYSQPSHDRMKVSRPALIPRALLRHYSRHRLENKKKT
jgi:hypothetical protein